MWFIIFLIGYVFGIFAATAVFVRESRYAGTLRIDRSDPNDKPYIFLELNKGVGDISAKRRVVLKVSNENYLPRE
jgi:hypothetical protein